MNKAPSEYGFLVDTIALFAGAVLSRELGAVPIIVGIILPVLVAYLVVVIVVHEVVKPRLTRRQSGCMTRTLVGVSRVMAWLAQKCASFMVGAALQILVVAWNLGGAVLFAVLVAVGVLLV